MQKGHTKARLEPQAPPKAHITLSKYCTWPCLKESCIYSGSMLIADSTYCRRRWGGEWHHFLWQLYESSQQGGGCRLGDTAKPYSLSTCLLRTTSQLAVFAFQVFGEFMKSVFYLSPVYFLSLSLFLQLQWSLNGGSMVYGRLGLLKMMICDLRTRRKASAGQPPCVHGPQALRSEKIKERYSNEGLL